MKNYQNLTNRENEVKDLLILGLTNGQIAKELFISIGTVKTHIKNIFEKLCVSNRMEVALCEIEKLRAEVVSLKENAFITKGV